MAQVKDKNSTKHSPLTCQTLRLIQDIQNQNYPFSLKVRQSLYIFVVNYLPEYVNKDIDIPISE